MVAISSDALTVIQRVTGHPALRSTSGLRIADRALDGTRLRVGVANGPRRGDKVLERQGGRLYLDPAAAERLEGKRIDAVTDDDGKVQFILRPAT